LNVFIPKEVSDGETRVAATPETVAQMVKKGLTVSVQAGAGEAAGFLDPAYAEAGATVSDDVKALYGAADFVAKVNPPGADEVEMLTQSAVLVGFLYPALNSDLVKRLAERGVTAFSMDMVPRISRAQKMDALSSQSNIAGYKAVLMAADALDKIFPLLMTAAGTIRPAYVVILGAGVAGLQAIATAKRLGAVVEVTDIRPAVKEQVESLGGRFIDMPVPEDAEDAGGYAKDLGEDFLKKQREILTEHISRADVVITTALIPGKPAPVLVTEEMVGAMRSGSVVVDLAAVMGGNCALTEPGRTVVKGGVKIIGEKNVPGLVPFHSSEMYSRNVLTVIQHLVTKEGERVLDFEDEITAGSIVTHDGKIRLGPDAQEEPLPALAEPAEEAGDEGTADGVAIELEEASPPSEDEKKKSEEPAPGDSPATEGE